MDNTLDIKLNRIDAAVATIKRNLNFEENALIEDVAASTDIKKLTNVFVQQNEPEVKDGIWVQCDEKENAFDKIIMDREMIVPYKWQYPDVVAEFKAAQGSLTGRQSSLEWLGANNGVVVNDKLYFIIGPNLGVYDLVQGGNIAVQHGTYRIYADKIDQTAVSNSYVFGINTQNCYAWNLETLAKTDVGVGGSYKGNHLCYSAFDNYMYLAYGNYGDIKRIHGDTLVQEAFMNSSTMKKISRLLSLGEKLLCISDKPGYSYIYDLASNTKLTTGPEGLSTLAIDNYAMPGFLELSDCFLVYNGLKQVIRYSKDTLLGEDITDQFNDPAIQQLCGMFKYKEDYYGIISQKENTFTPVSLLKMETRGKEYDSNAVLISQAPISRTEYQTALWTYDGLEGRMTQSFYDIFYYNKEKGFMKEYPIYYGNGTEWIKFKN